jgi:hypothetical protein
VREPERTWLADWLVILVSSVMASSLREYAGASGEDAADRVMWAIEAVVAHARAGAGTKGAKKRGRR